MRCRLLTINLFCPQKRLIVNNRHLIHPGPVARVILLMGVQRSGTNALFKSLSSSVAVRAYNESVDSPMFLDLDLRPEPEVRPVLESDPRPALLKPISETRCRSVADVLDEWGRHDVRVVWTYRDPVNCYHSHIVRWAGFRGRPDAFAAQWEARNRSVLDALASHGDRIALVRYEDLAVDAGVLGDLCSFLGIPGCYLFRADRAAGRQLVAPQEQRLIDGQTGEVLAELDRNRRFAARPAVRPLDARLRRLAGRLRRQAFKVGRVLAG